MTQDRHNAHGLIQTARGMCTDERPYPEIDAMLSKALDVVYELEALRDKYEPKHTTWVNCGDGTYQAVCVCGWKGMMRMAGEKPLARREAVDHVEGTNGS